MSSEERGDEWSVGDVRLRVITRLDERGPDALVVVTSPELPLPGPLRAFIEDLYCLDNSLLKQSSTCVARCELACGARLVVSSTGPLTPYDDVRSVGEAACRGVTSAVQAGAVRPALYLQRWQRFPHAPLVALVSALQALYVPLQAREAGAGGAVQALGVYAGELGAEVGGLLRDAAALETARALCRDIGGADPERMTPRRAAELVRSAFAPRAVAVRVLDDSERIREQYPLFAAVSRAADTVERHRGCIVFLEYVPESYEQTVLLVGKGVTYDTGGCDVKTGGAMAGMSRDKCGAAAVVGFFKACELLAPRLKAVGALALVRNSVGADAYVADELVTSRRGLRVRVGNTDAEGRLAMADLLAEMAELAQSEKSPHLYTIATLTGHAHRAVGPYTAALDNHAARRCGHAERLSAAGDALGEGVEVSRIRREDLSAHAGRGAGDSLQQAEARPSVSVPRGHQGPAAFLLLAAGLQAEGAPPYTHLDIAGSAGDFPEPPTAVPLLALASHLGLIALHTPPLQD